MFIFRVTRGSSYLFTNVVVRFKTMYKNKRREEIVYLLLPALFQCSYNPYTFKSSFS